MFKSLSICRYPPCVQYSQTNAANCFLDAVEALWTSVPRLRQLLAYALQLIHQPFCHSMILKSEKITASLNSWNSRSRLQIYSSYSSEFDLNSVVESLLGCQLKAFRSCQKYESVFLQWCRLFVSFITSLMSNLCTALTPTKITIISHRHKTTAFEPSVFLTGIQLLLVNKERSAVARPNHC